MRYGRRLFAALVGLLAALVVAVPSAAAPARADTIPPVQYCDIRITVPGQWAGGYVVSVDIRNISNVPVTWSASVTIPPPGYIVQAWNASVTVSGSSVRIWPWNPILLPGQSITFGYAGTGQLVLPQVTCQPVAGA